MEAYLALMRFDLTDLRLFLTVVEAGSITHGAAQVGLSLAAASERLREMEVVSGVMLLQRSRRGVTPTEAGEALLHHARQILSQMARMRSEIGQFAEGLRGTVRLFANTAAAAEVLPVRLGPWLAANPRADIDLKERPSAVVARNVVQGFAEIGVLSDAVDTAGLTLRPFALDRLVVVTARDHPLSGKGPVRLADIGDEPFVSLREGALQEHLQLHAARIGIRLKPRICLGTFDDICRMAGGGVGIGIVPQAAALRCRQSARIAITKLTDDWAIRHLALCTRSDADLTPLARSLLDHLVSSGTPA